MRAAVTDDTQDSKMLEKSHGLKFYIAWCLAGPIVMCLLTYLLHRLVTPAFTESSIYKWQLISQALVGFFLGWLTAFVARAMREEVISWTRKVGFAFHTAIYIVMGSVTTLVSAASFPMNLERVLPPRILLWLWCLMLIVWIVRVRFKTAGL